MTIIDEHDPIGCNDYTIIVHGTQQIRFLIFPAPTIMMLRFAFMLIFLCGLTVRGDSIDLGYEEFDDALKSSPFFVKFYSPNCGHCKKLVPVWQQVAKASPNYPEPFNVGEVDCTQESFLCERFGIRGVPSLIYFRDGMMYKFSGAREYNEIMKFGAGDYKKAAESTEIPPAGGSGVVGQAVYTLQKFVKDLIAILRFNYWAALLIFATGFMTGSVLIFTIMLIALSRGRSRASSSDLHEAVTEKPAEEKKSD
jgi:thiol-disulfide isomerase/thioredoxin